ncbi:MAG: type I glutamate--ammonia ligase [Candidatus Marinimicrobia bacterium]|nr:type I glutamate--ammonia ligase [Candidatus Neomarinimicrobiota bacterium]MCF7828653.1 type I glutamate--ammonia ligase [Candidatus Neomarinimicrobiota bacterium]MCF7880394.1 type I glutamate--ammonia ligase [Candidatus Neomarinimicrobiota bacterium]
MADSKSERTKVLQMLKDDNVEFVDFKFMDFPGLWQHITIPVSHMDEEVFEEGMGFDGSSIRGWQNINESDMVMIPDPATAMIDPFTEYKTLSLVCDIHDPITKERYTRCPRHIAQKATYYMQSTKIADTAYFGPEAEFFLFDDVRFDQTENSGYYFLDSEEGRWNSGKDEQPNLGYKPRYKEGYFPVAPHDSLMDIRSEMVMIMQQCGIDIEAQHHEVASGGQCEIDMTYSDMVDTADKLMLYKYIVKNTAKRHNKSATFMPKPIFADNGSGMHVHQSLWKKGENLFAGTGYAGLSEEGLYYIGGILKHAQALIAFSNPTTNSYKRLVPHFEAPVRLAYSQRNRSAALRIPMYSNSPKAKRVEFRCPDPSSNPYLAFSAMLMAGLDGIINKIDPGEPLDKNIYDMAPEELTNVPQTPASLEDALQALEDDHDFLLKGDVFTEDVLETWIKYKFDNEVTPMRLRPHPHEFELYYDL